MALSFPDHHAQLTPAKPAYVIGERVVSYRELVDTSIRIANLLRERGVRRGDTVAILLPNIAGLFEVAWACQRSGLRYTTINTRLNVADVNHILSDSGAVALFSSGDLAEIAGPASASGTAVTHRFTVNGPLEGFEALSSALASISSVPDASECEGGDLLYSSGTTGRPKGVSTQLHFLPLGSASGTGPFLQQTWGFDDETVYLSPAPLYHAAPLRFCMTVQRFGGTAVVMEKFDAVRALELIDQHRVTHTQMVPTMMIRMLQLPDEVRSAHDLSSLKSLIHAAAPCPPPVKKAMIDWLGPIVDEYYSCTEGNLLTLIRSEEALTHPGSVGQPVIGRPHILDDEGRELAVGEVGNIWSEDGLAFEYLHDPEKTAKSRNAAGWSTVGDLGRLDADGYLYMSDRRTDLILSGGVNVYPQEAENVLVTHPAVMDVGVVGVAHEELGEVAKAVVTLRSGFSGTPELAQELIDFCRQQLSTFKCPRAVEFAQELPRTPTGKLLRRALREQGVSESQPAP